MNVGNFTLQLVGTGLAIAVAFGLTMVLGFKDIPEAVAGAESGVVPGEASAIGAPVAGQIVPLSAVPDAVFSSGAMGNGIAVIPSEGKIYAPVSGTLVVAMPHAYGIRQDNGLEVLVHIGLDTVQLEGTHFTSHVTKDQRVEAGQLLSDFDIAAIRAAGFNPMTIMVVTNSTGYAAVVPMAEGEVVPATASTARRSGTG